MTRVWLCTSGSGAGRGHRGGGGDDAGTARPSRAAWTTAPPSATRPTRTARRRGAGGPSPRRRATRLSSPCSVRSASATTHPRTLRPWSTTRTRSPTSRGGAVAGRVVVEGPVDGGTVGEDPRDRGRQRQRPRARRSSSALGVCSQVNSRSGRPKCPYEAVLRYTGRRSSSSSMIAAGRRSNSSATTPGHLLGVRRGRVERLELDRDRARDADRVGDAHLAAPRGARGDDVLGDPARRVGAGAVDLGGVLARERAAAVARHAAVGVDDDLAAREPGVRARAAEDERAGGVRVDDELAAVEVLRARPGRSRGRGGRRG